MSSFFVVSAMVCGTAALTTAFVLRHSRPVRAVSWGLVGVSACALSLLGAFWGDTLLGLIAGIPFSALMIYGISLRRAEEE